MLMPDDPFGSMKINLFDSGEVPPAKKDSTTTAKKVTEPAKPAAARPAPPPAATAVQKAAADVCRAFELGDAAKELLKDGDTVGAFAQALLKKKQHVDVVRLVAHALPKPVAVRWAAGCAKGAVGDKPPLAETAALAVVEKWLSDSAEEHRRAAMPAAEAAGLGTPAGCAALAVFFSGGSLAPPDVPVVPPGEYLTAQAAANAVILAAVGKQPEKADGRFDWFVAEGLQLGGNGKK
jgi:hypothetical protein